jgi:UDP-2,3-diacylglucosamine pyrophosphatase LpxH
MSKTYYRSVWISDTHLCSRDCRADTLLSFLKHTKCEYLYIVGDFIDVWQLKRRWFWLQEFNNVIHRVLSKARKGAKVVYIPGNHDEAFRDFCGMQFGGVRIERDCVHTTADGRRFLVLHGDEFDCVVQNNKWLAIVGSAAYDYLIYANRMLNYLRRRMGMPYWSLAHYVKTRVKNAVSYIGAFEDAVVHAARKEKVDGVICGHIHQPAMKDIQGLQYCNTGDWVESCTALVEHTDGRLELIHWMAEINKQMALEPDLLASLDAELEEEELPLPVAARVRMA